MCGRMNVSDNEGVRWLMDYIGMPLWPDFNPRYNISPSSSIHCITRQPQQSKGIQVQLCQWGIIPVWAKPGQFSKPLINARAETVFEKPSFKNLVKHQRVCVPVTGYYEWLRDKGQAIPYFIYAQNQPGLFLGGIYQKTSETKYDLAILTVDANHSLSAIHHRMPVVIPPESVTRWLEDDDQQQLTDMMTPAGDNTLAFHQVSTYVNKAGNEGAECIEEVV